MATSKFQASVETKALNGKSILITGGAGGLGLATARHAALSGAYITIADVLSADHIVNELTEQGQYVQYVKCDVTNWESQREAFNAAIAFSPHKELDIVAVFAAVDDSPNLVDLINAAGDAEPTIPSTRCLDINLKGTLFTATLALHHLRPKGGVSASDSSPDKSLVFIASLAAYIDDTHDSAYTASKFGTRGLFRSIRGRASAELGIRANLIAPWALKTPMTEPVLGLLQTMGIKEGAGITFAKVDTMTDAVTRCMTERTLVGRALAVVPEGVFDIGDDVDGGYGGPELQRLMALRKTAGDFLHS